MQVHVSPEVGRLLEKATEASIHQEQLFVGVPHLLAAILTAPESLPREVEQRFLPELFAVLRALQATPWKGAIPAAAGEVFHTPRCIEIINTAERLARRGSVGSAHAGHLLLAILADEFSEPSRTMDRLGLNRKGCVAALRAGAGTPPPTQARAETADKGPVPATEDSAKRSSLPPFELTRDLTAAAASGKLRRAVGRSKDIFHVLEILGRQGKNNVILVGEAGVGKTQIVEGIAYRLARDTQHEESPPYRILELNMAALMAGTQYRGAFEERLLHLLETLKSEPNTVLFIDEIHVIMGAGATNGDSLDAANLLKPALARGEIRCIGATTIQEYRKVVAKDPALERRFQMLRVDELSEKATLKVLTRMRPGLEAHHGVKISSRALKSAVTLTVRYMPNRRLPDKAIDVLDQACARHKLLLRRARTEPYLVHGLPEKVLPHALRKVVSQLTGIPVEHLTAEERQHLTELERRLKEQLIGQDEAVDRMVGMVKKSRTGLSDPHRPDGVALFVGPSGVGKTQLAKLLAEELFGSREHLITFDMSEYIEEHAVSRLLGAPPGYVGSDQEGRLVAAIQNAPFSILLFDEIEKAHPRIFDIFLPLFEEGRLHDNQGREVDFRHCIIVMTSNIGAQILQEESRDQTQLRLLDELRGHFRPEFINRIDEIVPFYPLLSEDLREILRLEINAIRKRLFRRGVTVRMYQRAYELLAREGYSNEHGARELRRVVDRLVTTRISDLALREAFAPGDIVEVLEDHGSLTVRKVSQPAASGAAR